MGSSSTVVGALLLAYRENRSGFLYFFVKYAHIKTFKVVFIFELIVLHI